MKRALRRRTEQDRPFRWRAWYAEHGAWDTPWIGSVGGHSKAENGSLFSKMGTLEELESVIERQMRYCNRKRGDSAGLAASPHWSTL